MNWLNAPAYDIQRPTGHCEITGQPLCPGQAYVAALVESEAPTEAAVGAHPNDEPAGRSNRRGGRGPTGAVDLGLRRVDISAEAWDQGHRPASLFGYWRSTVPEAHEKKKQFVDDEVLMDLLARLGHSVQPEHLAFRFVLSLLLMRKKLLSYEGSESRRDASGQTQQWWRMKPKGSEQSIDVLNPQINDEQIQQVTEQLGQILESEL